MSSSEGKGPGGTGAVGRMALAFCAVGLATLFLVPFQWLALRTGLFSSSIAPRLWNRIAVKILGWRVRIEGRLAGERPLLVAANHVSWGDILVLAAQADLSFIAKSEVAGWPLFGLLAKLNDTIFIDREKRSTTGAQAAAIAERLDRSAALVLFPEGTTADGNRLLPFKSSLFGSLELAMRKASGEAHRRIAVQPVAIAYTRLYGLPMGHWERNVASWIGDRSLLFHLRLLFSHGPLDVTLCFGEPIVLDGRTGRKEIARQAERDVARMMAEALRG